MTEQNARPRPKGREAYRHFTAFATRWRDNDQYGHMNNAVYYELFDSAVNKFLIDSGILALAGDKTQFLVASSGCDYFTDVAYPSDVDIGLAVRRMWPAAPGQPLSAPCRRCTACPTLRCWIWEILQAG